MLKKKILLLLLIPVIIIFAYNFNNNEEFEKEYIMNENNSLEKATFGSGCFWCTEAIFEKLNGVESVVSGYSGGTVVNPTYKEVTTGRTGHAEVTQIIFDPKIISFKELLEVFWQTHDPTTLNQQGNDVGTQYRSAIFYHNEEQKKLAEEYKKKLEDAKVFEDPIVTEITKFDVFYTAEDYHQDYYEQNKSQPYCSFVITPKVDKFKKVFKDKLK
jgi:peptide-methionine (S)-S-oxide reductase